MSCSYKLFRGIGVGTLGTLLLVMQLKAAVRFVDLHSPISTPPYTDWSTAATNIQDAIDAATVGDEIIVTNGIYETGGRVMYGAMTNRVAVNKAVVLRSANGPEVTVIRGYQMAGSGNGDEAVRCVYLANDAV